ncbi:hypothetical protein PR048_013462 [Dryococelus australis]|uniref:Uncharacterized protein n=1 Tax=Dryococelus australis TaxID=614101 RepID=A0ABQ9HSA0_9NEOP|nr:hypothetical protein PR048_013462 [Dryococelus australis]
MNLLLMNNTVGAFVHAEFYIIECTIRGRQHDCQHDKRILDIVQHSPTVNTHSLSAPLCVSGIRIWRTLYDESSYPLHP